MIVQHYFFYRIKNKTIMTDWEALSWHAFSDEKIFLKKFCIGKKLNVRYYWCTKTTGFSSYILYLTLFLNNRYKQGGKTLLTPCIWIMDLISTNIFSKFFSPYSDCHKYLPIQAGHDGTERYFDNHSNIYRKLLPAVMLITNQFGNKNWSYRFFSILNSKFLP